MFKIRRAKKNLFSVTRKFRRYRKRLTPEIDETIKNQILLLREAINHGDAQTIENCSNELISLAKKHLKRSFFYYFRDTTLSLAVALIVAIFVRQMWFELFEVPTGSMRTTIEEHDRLLVSKTTFGLNVPLTRKHFFFNEDAIKRGSIIVFTGKGLDIPDNFTYYFYLFPGYKQYVKRCMGKPGDTLYFYGGRIYGIDQYNRDITAELERPEELHINHIPFIKLDGQMQTLGSLKNNTYEKAISYQMHVPTCTLTTNLTNRIDAKILFPFISEYYNLWGFRNYGITRLLTPHEFQMIARNTAAPKAVMYLHIAHHANTKNAHMATDYMGRKYPNLGNFHSYLPLTENHLKKLMDNLYTGRFTVKDGHIASYGYKFSEHSPSIKGVPNGIYEFTNGEAYKIGPGSMMTKLSKDHPLYTFSEERVRLFYNLGMLFDNRFNHPLSPIMPHRYAFFRNHNLYLMGAPILRNDDPALELFLHEEYIKQEAAPSYNPYPPFEDTGPPLNPDGSLDVEFIAKYGMKIPMKHYLALGDNYAGSSDSRDFGFVPEGNIKGSPKLIFWPLGPRFGPLNQPSSYLFSLSNCIIWILAILAYILWRLYKSHIEKCDL